MSRYDPETDPVEVHRCRLAFSLLPREAPATLLDVGCGDGYFCEYVRRRLKRSSVCGIDLAAARLTRAMAERPGAQLLAGSAQALPFADGAFDTVTCIEVLEHLADPLLPLRELARVSSRYVVVTVPNGERLSQVVCPNCLTRHHPYGHLSRFDEQRLVELGAEAGLAVERFARYLIPVGLRVGLPRGFAAIGNWLRHVGGARPEFLGALLRKPSAPAAPGR